MRNTVRQKRVKKARVIPGFRCTFGIVVLMNIIAGKKMKQVKRW